MPTIESEEAVPASLEEALAAINGLADEPETEQAKPAPKVKKTRQSSRTRSPVSRTTPINKLEDGVENLYCNIGMALLAVSPIDATVFIRIDPSSEEMIQPTVTVKKAAQAWIQLAEQSPRVRRFLESLSRGGAWSGVAAANAPILLAIMANHGINPLEFLLKRGGEKEDESIPGNENPPSPGPIRLVNDAGWRDPTETDFGPVH
jgi:hypothetical protein